MEIKKYLKIFWIYKTCAHDSVSDKYKAGKAGIYKGGDAYEGKRNKGNAGK